MRIDYVDAATRHRDDAELLRAKSRWPNADQLYGMAAECALKATMRALGMPVRNDGAPQRREHRVHIDELWNAFFTFAGNIHDARYVAMLPWSNPFQNWSVHQRYQHSSSISSQQVDEHRMACRQVFLALNHARLEGML